MASSHPQPGAPGARRGLPSDLAADVRATAQAAQELGPQYHDALAESLADKVEAELRERRLPIQAPAPAPPAHPAGAGQQLALAIVSLGVGIPLTAIAANAGNLDPLIGMLIVWIGIVLVNVVFNGPTAAADGRQVLNRRADIARRRLRQVSDIDGSGIDAIRRTN